ncbi:MAG: type I 3-dehydroquinate dehydratase, partial [Planctomycetes bacterium]|nr:type I 3-dehydroquinate dehydratase [Planctomycetota bacterium]
WPRMDEALSALTSVARPAIFTCRHMTEGGSWEGEEAARIRLFREAYRRGAALLDVEARAPASSALLDEGLPVMLSWHDFDASPPNIIRTFRDLEVRGPLGAKLVPTARGPADSLRLLEALAEAPKPKTRVGFSMGWPGVFTRILAPAWGSVLTYGALGRGVAPGQLSAADLRLLCPKTLDEPRILIAGAGAGILPVIRAARIAADSLGRPAAILPVPFVRAGLVRAGLVRAGLVGGVPVGRMTEEEDDFRALRLALEPAGAILEEGPVAEALGAAGSAAGRAGLPAAGGGTNDLPARVAIRWDSAGCVQVRDGARRVRVTVETGRAPDPDAERRRLHAGQIVSDVAWILDVPLSPDAVEAAATALE